VSLYQGLSLRENVEFYAGLYGLAGAELERRWRALSDRFALAEAERERPEDLPAGIRQRAGLALSTLHEPRLLFLDEPTAGVDVRSRDLFWELIQDEADQGVTVFVTTHFVEEVDYCDWVSFIDAGRLIANATPEALRERYSDGYRVTLELPAAGRAAAEAALAAAGARVTAENGTLVAAARALGPALRATLARLEADDVAIRVEQPPMTDIFRRMVAEAGAAR
jgi:ABC-2 type transport system ATP-binding protein